MAALVVNNGLQRIGCQASQATSGSGPTYSSARQIQTMAIDDNATGFTATDTAENSVGSVTNQADQAFDSTPTRSSQTITHITTYATGTGNFTQKRFSLHDDTAANTSSSSATLVSGVDGQTIAKTSSFSEAVTLKHTYS